MDFGSTLKNIRCARELTQSDLAKKIGVSTVCIGNWERGTRKPTLDAIVALCDTLSVSANTLLDLRDIGDEAPVLSPAEHTLLKNYRKLDAHGKLIVDTVCSIEAEELRGAVAEPAYPNKILRFPTKRSSDRYIPRYTSPSAAGFNAPLDGDEFEMILVDSSVPEEADFSIYVKGTSMEPYIQDGQIVYVNKDAELNIGDVGIFSVDGSLYCKQYYRDELGNLILVSANPEMESANIFIGKDSDHSVRMCGKVLLDKKVPLPDYLFHNDL